MKNLLACLSLLLLLTGTALAGVNLKNGNFYISYTDHSYIEKNGYEIMRTYNSKHVGKGIFGFGWGSEIETRLVAMGEGIVVIYEHGAGAANQFNPTQADRALMAKAVEQIIQAAIKEEDIENTPTEVAKFRTGLLQNMEQRTSKWRKYAEKGLLKNPDFAVKTKWTSYDLGYQELEKTASGFKRTNEDGSYDLFTTDGKFTHRYDSDGAVVFNIEYGPDNRIQKLTDRIGNVFVFEMNETGQALRITSPKGTSTYKYSPEECLIYSQDVEDNTYLHEYDESYNMTAISYTDGTRMTVTYDRDTFFVTKIVDRQGHVVHYNYFSFYHADGTVNNDHYATSVLRPIPGETKADSSYYEYEIRTGETGNSYTYRILTFVGGIETETIYNECCGMPLRVSRNKEITTYEYDAKGNMLKKETPEILQTASFKPATGKLNFIETLDKVKNKKVKVEYIHDKKGNLVEIRRATESVRFEYNADKRISLIHSAGKQMKITYNYSGKPTKIESNDGAAEITYNNDNQIEKVTGPQGEATANSIKKQYDDIQEMITAMKFVCN